MKFFDKIVRVEFRSTRQIRCPRKGEWIRSQSGNVVQALDDFHVSKYEILERVEVVTRPGLMLLGALLLGIVIVWTAIFLMNGGA